MKRTSPILIAALFLLVAAAFSVPAVFVRDVYREWSASHKSLYQYIEPQVYTSSRFNGLVNKVYAGLFGSSRPGLEQVHIYVSEQKLRSLQKNLPASVKDWKKGKMLFPDGNLENVQVRHRGDNPFNWLYEKKSWRIKTRKERMLGTVRSLNLIAPQDPVFIDTHFYLRLAQNCGLVGADSRMVELFVNGRAQGVHTEVVQIDENFLRNNRMMPVNLYKGEQRMSERRYGMEFDLYSGPALWTKVSVNNYTLDPAGRHPLTDMSDLDYIMRVSQEALFDDDSFERLLAIVDSDYLARFAAYEILTQQSYDALHNNRLVADIWKGKVVPLPIDPQAVLIENPEDVKFYQFGSRQGILDRLERSPEFRTATMKKLKVLLDSGCLPKTIGEMRALAPRLGNSLSRDSATYQTLGRRSFWDFDIAEEVDGFLAGYEILEKELRRRLALTGPTDWSAGPGRLSITSGSPTATGPWVANLALSATVPEDLEVWWDKDGDGEIGPDDLRLPHSRLSSGFRIDAGFAGNFQRHGNIAQSLIENYGSTPEILPASFHLLFNHPELTVVRLAIQGADSRVEPSRMRVASISPNRVNRPVLMNAKTPKTNVYRGEVMIEGVRVERGPVRVEAGTHFRMAAGASLVFRGKTTMNGTQEKPIRFEPAGIGGRWGVVALQGPDSGGSTLRHVHFSGGTGAQSGLTRFIAMLSIHDTSDILLDRLHLADNSVEDDMMHIIYSKNVIIRDVEMEGAMSDAIDIDISSVTVEGGTIRGSGNDAIDLMSTAATIKNVRLLTNGDKGVSVGEGSTATILDSDIRGNAVGVQSKDGSSTVIENSRFERNRLQLSAYKKNWRYAAGGRIVVRNSDFVAANGAGDFSADSKSRIDVHDSRLQGAASVEGGVWFDGSRRPEERR